MGEFFLQTEQNGVETDKEMAKDGDDDKKRKRERFKASSKHKGTGDNLRTKIQALVI